MSLSTSLHYLFAAMARRVFMLSWTQSKLKATIVANFVVFCGTAAVCGYESENLKHETGMSLTIGGEKGECLMYGTNAMVVKR